MSKLQRAVQLSALYDNYVDICMRSDEAPLEFSEWHKSFCNVADLNDVLFELWLDYVREKFLNGKICDVLTYQDWLKSVFIQKAIQ